MLAVALALLIGGVFYSRLPQSGAPDTQQPAPAAEITIPTCTVSNSTTRVTIHGLRASDICLRWRDLYDLELNAPAAHDMADLAPRCTYRDGAADEVTVELSSSASTDVSAAEICHDLAADASWQVVQ